MGLIKAGWRRSSIGPKEPPGACGLCATGRQEHLSVKMAVRLVYAFDCSFRSKDLTLKREPNLELCLLGLKPRAAFNF